MSARQLAQFNIARLRQPLDHPASAGFADAGEGIHALAGLLPGFVWRIKPPAGSRSDGRRLNSIRPGEALSSP